LPFEKTNKDRLAVWNQNRVLVAEFEKVLFELMTHSETIYINTNEHYRASVETETREARFVKWWKTNIQHMLQK
jgi:Xaa-Pro aminopeptidase